MFQFDMGGMRGGPQRFEEQYHCMSFAMSGKQLVEESDKILLPASALETLARLNVEYPMLFEISADGAVGGLKTHCGVLEFSADESTLKLRYVAALSIIANFANDIDPTLIPDDEKVDLSICKMIMDGHIEIEELSDSIH